jgi:hypothetical protein
MVLKVATAESQFEASPIPSSSTTVCAWTGAAARKVRVAKTMAPRVERREFVIMKERNLSGPEIALGRKTPCFLDHTPFLFVG